MRMKGSLRKVRTASMYEQGFTLIELMIALAVLAIIISLAAPSFVTMIQNNRATGATNDLIASLQLARTEAIKSNGAALLQSINGTSDWGDGHRIGVDLNSDGDILDANELLRNVDAPHSSISITSADNAVSEITYNGTGGVTSASTTTFTIDTTRCETGVTRKVRKVQIGLSGGNTLSYSTETCP